jgi:nucleoside 2-deoxyribosyltransferase
LEDWNSANSRSQSVSLQALRWELDAVPSTGDGPQQTINKQLVETSDILIAVFWTRLGTPTDVAPSGTAEEIEYFRSQGKPVLLYFSEADVPHDHDLEQLRLLRQYRKTLQANTLYQVFRDPESLRRRVTRDLSSVMNKLATTDVPRESKSIIGGTTTLNRDWPGDWKELASKFEDSTKLRVPQVVADYTQGEGLDSWNWRGGPVAVVRNLEALCKLAGKLLVASPNVSRSIAPEIRAQPDPVSRWLFYLKEKRGAFKVTGHGTTRSETGGEIDSVYGSIEGVAALSASECLSCAADEF